MPSTVNELFKQLIKAYQQANIDYPGLKAVSLAQWMLESGRGTSELATQHYNFGGLKWRSEMAEFATKIGYEAHDGFDFYCRFSSLENFIKGYWAFIARSPYKGWEAHAGDGTSYIKFIGPIYTPNAGYVQKVLNLLPEATQLLGDPGPIAARPSADDLPEDVTSHDLRTFSLVIDPGHGGTTKVGGSSPNNATSFSGRKEKDMTLDMAKRVMAALEGAVMAAGDIILDAELTRNNDSNLGLADRANVARDLQAHAFLSIHFNAYDGKARGVETLVLPKANGNVNFSEDVQFANRIQSAVLGALRKHDASTKDRGVKSQQLGVLSDVALGNTNSQHRCRACLLEVEFIDVKAVDDLLKQDAVCNDIAAAIAKAIVEDLRVRPL